MTETLLFAARAAHFVGLVQLAGVYAFAVFVAHPAALQASLRRIALVSWLMALAGGAAWFYAQSASMSGTDLAGALPALGTVLAKTEFGWVSAVRLALLLLVAPGLPMCNRLSRRLSGRVAALALLSLAWSGHANGEEGLDHTIHLAADVVHLLAAGAWVGGLLPLVLLFARASKPDRAVSAEDAHRAARRFSRLGIVAVTCLFASGLVNTWYLAGNLPALIGTFYGRLLLLKIALFAVMLGFAAVNRRRLTPRLAQSRDRTAVLRALRRNSAAEFALGLFVLGIVAWLGTLVPGLHQEPVWPLPFRFSAEALAAPELRGEVWLALAALAIGLLLIAASFRFRRMKGVLVVVWLLIIAFFVPSLDLLAVTAFPTSYFYSPTGDTAAAVARGTRVFAEQCASCHGATGRGDGPLAKSLAEPPADLTADHVYAHSDGDLFWWIGHGIAGTPMPGFDGALDEETRWELVDFIHANADGVRAAQGTPAQPPDFDYQCPDGTVGSLRSSKGRIVHLLFAPDAVRLTALAALDAGGDVITVVAGAGGAAGFCVAAGPEIASAFGLYLPDRSKGISGAEMLIDANGWLRAVWQPALGSGWRDPAALIADIGQIRASPVTASPRPAGHVH